MQALNCQPPPPTPEALQALVEQDRQVLAQLAAFTSLIDFDEAQHEHAEYFQHQLEALSAPSRPFANALWTQALRGGVLALSEDQINSLLRENSFPHWLHFVVEKLAPEAQTVVIPELWEHFSSGLDEAADLPEEQAHQQALQNMGSAKDVAKWLNKVHLTATEKEMGTIPVRKREALGSLGWVIFLCLLLIDSPYGFYAGALLAALLFGLLVLRPFQPREDPVKQARVRAIYQTAGISAVGCVVILQGLVVWDVPDDPGATPYVVSFFVLGIACFIMAGFAFRASVRLTRKIRRCTAPSPVGPDQPCA